ncbi:MAG: hypothetical protein L3J81_06705 [Thermoplasmata archaeon]|nr:hypothetical protein [Thermoplasmata archaeon]
MIKSITNYLLCRYYLSPKEEAPCGQLNPCTSTETSSVLSARRARSTGRHSEPPSRRCGPPSAT